MDMKRRPDAATIKAGVNPRSFYKAELPEMKEPRRMAGGWVDGGLCPFHADGRAGSFRVHLETGAFCCFACGAKGGDIVAFVQQREGLSFHDALAKLTDDWEV
ncbi:hypothetical protein JWZ97_02540 [Methylococcus sp. EFPC2]|nr:hypothetical protein JWZ97_02540 [Methylococcus sp. EFPC2]